MRTEAVFEEHLRVFGSRPERIAVAPGRVNLIGEHTDYNQGFVFPMAIEKQVHVAISRRKDRRLGLWSLDFREPCLVDLDRLSLQAGPAWAGYPQGVVQVFLSRGFSLDGMNLSIQGDVPQGSGLSSSAALEVATGLAIQALCDLSLSGTELALLAQRAECEFVGVQCGIMDQFVSRLAERGHALLIDCRTLEYRQVPLALGDACILVTDSRTPRRLAGSAYNQRRQECEQGVAVLRAIRPGESLRDFTSADLEAVRSDMSEVVLRRCRHVVEENQRVLDAEQALRRSDLGEFGRLMSASHQSLRDLYEVSCPELDHLVELALDTPGVYGSRITGAGFGGCTVSLIERDAVPSYQEACKGFAERFGRLPVWLVSTPSSGARII
jgi:galactokinase